ncbi:MAG: hypothetical protein JNN31_11395 [Dechloromonas sp.]|nr:hypothetical protein [Dechloromonas sp.]
MLHLHNELECMPGGEVERVPGIFVLPAGERAAPGKLPVTLCKTSSITKVKVVALDIV